MQLSLSHYTLPSPSSYLFKNMCKRNTSGFLLPASTFSLPSNAIKPSFHSTLNLNLSTVAVVANEVVGALGVRDLTTCRKRLDSRHNLCRGRQPLEGNQVGG